MAAARGRARKTRKGHTVGAVQPSTNFIISNSTEDNLSRFQAQQLGQRIGITPAFASVLAPFVFGRAA